MSRLMKSRAQITVHVPLEPPAGERVIVINPGLVVDFDEIVRPARPGRDALTLAEALGFQPGEPRPGRPSRPPGANGPADEGDPGEPEYRALPGHTVHFDPYTPPAEKTPAKTSSAPSAAPKE